MADHGPLAGRPAKRHYASIANEEGQAFTDVIDWLRSVCGKLESDSKISMLLKSGEIEALFWIAFFGESPVIVPTLEQDILNSVTHLNTSVLFENYTILSEGCPTKTWYSTKVA